MVGRRTVLTLGLAVLFLLTGLSNTGYGEDRYKVKRGDSLSKIAKKYGVTTQALREANGLRGDALKIRQVLVIPKKNKTKNPVAKTKKQQPAQSVALSDIHIVKKGDTLYRIANHTGVSVSEIKALNHLRSTKLREGQQLIISKRTFQDDTEELGDEDDIGDDGITEADDDKPTNSVLGKWKSSDERKILVKVAKTFLGVPYRLGGSTMQGLDCSAFVKKIYEIFDIHLPRTAREQSLVGKWVSRDELEEGDLVFFKTRSRKVTGHVGIYIGDNEFVHASGKNRGTKIDNLSSGYYSRQFFRGVRVMELDQELAKKPENPSL
jgi:cell wall-associated NlpC family hydrolase